MARRFSSDAAVRCSLITRDALGGCRPIASVFSPARAMPCLVGLGMPIRLQDRS
jgi:hypothetical protein